MLKLLRRVVFGLLPVYAYLALMASTKLPSFRSLNLDMREGMIRNYLYYQTDQHIVEMTARIHRAEREAGQEMTTTTLWQDENKFIPELDNTDKILALLSPPGIIGGYRNQFIRFLSLIKYAQLKGIHKLLLPSLLWSTTHREAKDEMRFYPIPMQFLFDVDHWNTFNQSLPLLLESVPGESDCWKSLGDVTTRAEIDRRIQEEELRPKSKKELKKPYLASPMTNDVLKVGGYLTPVANATFDYLAGKRTGKPRKTNLFPAVEHCQNPMVIGGGKGAGILWNMWDRMQRSKNAGPMSVGNEELIIAAHQALRPNEKWREVANQCIHHNLKNDLKIPIPSQFSPLYLALHARVEVDFMVHHCGKETEKNLTKIFDMVDNFSAEYNSRHPLDQQLGGTFIAISRNNMRQPWRDPNVLAMSAHNWDVLNERSSNRYATFDNDIAVQGNSPKKQKVFECGEIWMDRWYKNQDDVPDDYYGSILPSVLNFYIATQATVFVGVEKSSWSADVWVTRFHLGKGENNYKYTPDNGIVPLENGGRPPTHLSCRKMDQAHSHHDESSNHQ